MGKMIRDPTVPVQPERLPSGEVAPAASALAELRHGARGVGIGSLEKPPVAQWIEQRFPTPLRLFDSGSAIRPAQVLFSKQRTTPEIRGKSVLFLKPLKGALVLRLSRGEESP